MMDPKVAAVALLLCMQLLAASGASLKKCEDDHQCGSGEYCYTKTRTCTPCVQCTAYKRQDGKGSCSKEPLLCGDCIEGFQPEILINGRARDLCVPNQATAAPRTMAENNSSWTSLMLFVGFAILGVVAIFAVRWMAKDPWRIKLRTRFLSNSDSGSVVSSVLYAPSAPPQTLGIKDEECQFVGKHFHVEKKEERFQCASKYLDPVWVKSPIPPEVQQEQGGDEIDGPPSEVNPPSPQAFLIDENTMPSSWTPGPEYDTAQSSTQPMMITNFTDALRLNALTSGGSEQAGPSAGNHNASSEQPQQNNAQHFTVNNITVINTSGNSSTGVFNITGN